MLAVFMAILFVVPFDSIKLPGNLPVDTQIDRLALVVLVIVWLISAAAGGASAPRLRSSVVHGAVALFFVVAIASVVLNLDALNKLDELGLTVKKLALVLSFVVFFLIVASVVRPSELRAFGLWMLVLAAITALGTVYEYRTGTNLFFNISDTIFPGSILDPGIGGIDSAGRKIVVGPTQQGLAVSGMLAMALPFAVIRILDARTTRQKWVSGILTALLVAGAVSTLRKTSMVAPAAGLLVLLIYRPKAMLRLLPLGIVLVAVVHLISPGALGSVKQQLIPSNSVNVDSTKARTADYDAIVPDVRKHIALGRGYGSYDPKRYRFLDNEYLGRLVETGIVGLVAYLILIAATIGLAHGAIRARDPVRGPPALAIAAGAGTFAVTSTLFDVLSFPQAPYVFFFLAGLAAVCTPGLIAERAYAPARGRRPVLAMAYGALRGR
jgi:O-antigen ligase/polysaccharide polymerase Wzy-like membrane protein